MNLNERTEYIRVVVQAVYGKEPEDVRMPSMDWGIIASWMDKGVPLATVLQVVGEIERHPSVTYIRRAVEEEEERRLRSSTN